MRYYELTYLISPDLSEDQAKTVQEKVIILLQDHGGLLDKIVEPKLINLGYPIRKKERAYLATLLFNFDPQKVEILDKKLKAVSEILRFLIVSKKLPKVSLFVPPKKVLAKPEKEKVEIEEIEKKLEEILGQSNL